MIGLKRYPVLSLNRTALWTPCHTDYQCLILCWYDVAFPYSLPLGFMSYPVKSCLENYEDMVDVLLMLLVLPTQDQEIEHLIY